MPSDTSKAPDDQQLASLLSCPADFDSNFSSEYEVELAHPIDDVFHKLGEGITLEASVRLSDLCRGFQLLSQDVVELDRSDSLETKSCRSLPALSSSSLANGQDADRVHGSRLERQFFWLQEAVPILPAGLYDHMVTIAGCLTTDRERHMALYESSASGGILIWKWRCFTPTASASRGGGGTRVREIIKGKSGRLLRGVVEKETRRAHRCV